MLELWELLQKVGFVVQIETSGSVELSDEHRRSVQAAQMVPKCGKGMWITLSPKANKPPVSFFVEAADEIKIPVEHDNCFIPPSVVYRLSEYDNDSDLLLFQPVAYADAERSKRAIKYAIELATRHGARLSLQTHKFIHVR